jgi:two-component system CheB/CheR fusion protein
MRALPYRSGSPNLDGAVLTFVDVTELAEAEAHHKMLVEELNHRVKNMLTVITSIANQTFASSVPDPKQAFMGRIHALATTYGLISRENWQNVSLEGMLREGITPYDEDSSKFFIKGPAVWLSPQAALAMGLVLHELATNAVKHGALSSSAGRVSITWRVERAPEPGSVVVEWIESGGPKVMEPDQKGFGTELISREFEYQLGGAAQLKFDTEGFKATLEIPCKPEFVVLGCY